MRIRLDVLQFLQNKLAETSLKTPQRIQFIPEQIRLFVDSYTEDFNYVSLDINLPQDEEYFTPALENISYLSKRLPRFYQTPEKMQFEMKVLMPDETYCCQNGFRIASTVRIFDVQKVFPAFYYHGRCRHCKKNTTIIFRKQRIFKARSQQQYFVIASGVGFTVDLLNEVSLQVTIGNVSFEKLSEIYNTELSLYGTDMILSSDLLEGNWILFRLISEVNILKWERKAENSHYNTEKNLSRSLSKIQEYCRQ